MLRRVADALVLDLALILAWDAICGLARFWLSWRSRPRGPVDPSLVGRLLAEMFER